jgi:magnesium chelatase family protein
MMQRYVAKVSGPLLDRIDIHIEVPAVKYRELRSAAASEGSAEIRARVLAARARQHQRFAADRIYTNAQMHTRQIRTYCELSPEAERLLERAMQQQGLSARAHDRILKVARTIADLDAQPDITVGHIAEAIQYRTLDRSYWS